MQCVLHILPHKTLYHRVTPEALYLKENVQLLAHDPQGGAAILPLQTDVQGKHETVQRG
jgi:hypothetical protein